MEIALPPKLEAALAAQAQQRGITAEELAVQVLRKQLLPVERPVPQDEWERRLLSAAVDCGVSLSDEALSRENIY